MINYLLLGTDFWKWYVLICEIRLNGFKKSPFVDIQGWCVFVCYVCVPAYSYHCPPFNYHHPFNWAVSFSVLTFRSSMYDLSCSKNVSNSNYNPIFISFLRWWNMLGKIINVMPGVKMNWSLYQKEAIQAVCLVSSMCFGSFLAVTSLQSTALVGGGESLCDPPDCVARRLVHLMELSAGVVRSVSFRHSTDCTLEPPASLKKYWCLGHTSKDPYLMGMGTVSWFLAPMWYIAEEYLLAALTASCQIKAVSLSISWPRQPAVVTFTVSQWLSALALNFSCLWEKGRMESSVIWTSIHPLWHHFIALGPHSLLLWLIPSPRINNIHIVEVQKLSNGSVRWIPWVTELPSALLPELHSSSVLTVSSVSNRMKGGGEDVNLGLILLKSPWKRWCSVF